MWTRPDCRPATLLWTCLVITGWVWPSLLTLDLIQTWWLVFPWTCLITTDSLDDLDLVDTSCHPQGCPAHLTWGQWDKLWLLRPRSYLPWYHPWLPIPSGEASPCWALTDQGELVAYTLLPTGQTLPGQLVRQTWSCIRVTSSKSGENAVCKNFWHLCTSWRELDKTIASQ